MRRLPKTHKKLPMEKEDEPNFRKLSPLPQLGERQEQDYWNRVNRERQDGFVAVTPPHGKFKDQQHNLMMKAASAVVDNDDVVVLGSAASCIPTKLRSLGGGGFCDEQSQLPLPLEHQVANPMLGGGVVENSSYGSFQQNLKMQTVGLGMNSQFHEQSMMNHQQTMMASNNMMDSTRLTATVPPTSQYEMAHMYRTQQHMMQPSLPNNHSTLTGSYDGNCMMMPSSSIVTMGDPYQQGLQYAQPQVMGVLRPQSHFAPHVGTMSAANTPMYYDNPSTMPLSSQPHFTQMGSFI